MPNQSEFLVFDARHPEQRAAWLAAWNDWPLREVFAHPGYVEIFAQPADRALCALLRHPGGFVIHPFILRDVSREAFAAEVGPVTDVAGPYGYGGPYAWGDAPEAVAQSFWAHMEEWAATAGVVSEFLRFPLWDGPATSYPGQRVEMLDNVVRSLDDDEETIWMDFEHKVRKNVKKARRSGVEVEVDPEGSRCEEFLTLYHETMRRRGAGAGYYFPREFFQRIHAELAGQFCYFHAVHEGAVVSTELVLVSSENVYSFLGGTDERRFEIRPNDLLKFEIIRWARAAGKRRFVLGGGYRRDDGIYQYKRAFAPRGAMPFSVGRRVLRPDAYEELVRARARAEPGWTPSDFFPAYRG